MYETTIQRRADHWIAQQHEAGAPVAQLCRDHNVSPGTFYKWKSKFGGMDVNEAKRLKQLEEGNAKLKKLLAESLMDNAALKESLTKKLVTPAAKKRAVQILRDEHGYSPWRACRLVRCNRTSARRISTRVDDVRFRERLRELAQQRSVGATGCSMEICGWRAGMLITSALTGFTKKSDSFRGPNIASESKARNVAGPRRLQRLTSPGPCISPVTRCATAVLNVIDVFTRRCLAIETDTSLSSERVVRVIERLRDQHGTPRLLQIDIGPEFRGHKLDQWAKPNQVELHFMDPGKPTQNGHPPRGHPKVSTADSATNV